MEGLRSALVTTVVCGLLAVSCTFGPTAITAPPAAVVASSPTAQSTGTPSPTLGAPLTWITPSPPLTCTEGPASGSLGYQSGARSYFGYLFRPAGSGPFPAMLVLHSGLGLTDHERAYGRWLADQGYIALAPDYFAPVGATSQTLDKMPYDIVREDLARAVDCLRSLAYVDRSRVGAVGFSLGGYFALALGTREDVHAVISYSTGNGPYDPNERNPMATLATQMRAPVQLLEGGAEIGAAHVRALQDSLMAAGKSSQIVSYPGVGQIFDFVTIGGAPQ